MSELDLDTRRRLALALVDGGQDQTPLEIVLREAALLDALDPILTCLIAEAEQRGAERVAARVEAVCVNDLERVRDSLRKRATGRTRIDMLDRREANALDVAARWVRAALKDGTP